MLEQLNRGGHSGHSKQIKDWIKKYLGLSDRFTIMVSELKCTEPDCPPLETIVALFGSSGLRYQRKLHLPVKEITEAEAQRLAKLLQQDMQQQYADEPNHKEDCDEQH